MRAWGQRLAVAGALTVVSVVVRLPVLVQHRAIDDEVNYSVVARVLMHGGTLYVDAVERRPPLTFWLYELVFRLFGPDNWVALHATGVLWVLLTMAAIATLASRLFGVRAGVAAALLYSVVQPWWYWGNLAFNGEVLMNLPVATAYAICLRREGLQWFNAAAAGALIALAFLLKQPAAIAIVPLVVYIAHPSRACASWRRRLADVAALFAGCAAVLIAACGWLARGGLLGDAFYWSVGDHDVPHVFWTQGAEHTAVFALMCLPILIGSLWTARQTVLWSGLRAERSALVGLLVVSAVGVAASGRFFPHYYIGLLPPLVVLASPALTGNSRGTAWNVRMPIALAGAWTACAVASTLVFQVVHGADLSQTTEAGKYMRGHSAGADRVFIWGRTPEVYLDAERQPASRYIDTFALTGRIFGPDLAIDTSGRVLPGAWAHLRDDFELHPPTFVLDTQSKPGAAYPVWRFPWLAVMLRDRYIVVRHVVEGTLYERRANVTLPPFAMGEGRALDTAGGIDTEDAFARESGSK